MFTAAPANPLGCRRDRWWWREEEGTADGEDARGKAEPSACRKRSSFSMSAGLRHSLPVLGEGGSPRVAVDVRGFPQSQRAFRSPPGREGLGGRKPRSRAGGGGPFPQNRQRMASTGPGRNGGDRAAHVKAKQTVRGGRGTATSASGSDIDTIISVRDPLSSEAFNIIKQESPIFTAGMFLVALHLPFSGRNEFPQFRFYDHR